MSGPKRDTEDSKAPAPALSLPGMSKAFPRTAAVRRYSSPPQLPVASEHGLCSLAVQAWLIVSISSNNDSQSRATPQMPSTKADIPTLISQFVKQPILAKKRELAECTLKDRRLPSAFGRCPACTKRAVHVVVRSRAALPCAHVNLDISSHEWATYAMHFRLMRLQYFAAVQRTHVQPPVL